MRTAIAFGLRVIALTKIGRVVVVGYYADRRSFGFTVKVSPDGQHWETVANRRNNKEQATPLGYSCLFARGSLPSRQPNTQLGQ